LRAPVDPGKPACSHAIESCPTAPDLHVRCV
jgi:hypothetical protein